MPKLFPKILIITKNKINQIDGHGVSLRNWFFDWPKENLAHIYSNVGAAKDELCGYNYLFSGNDRRLGWIFDKLKGSELGLMAVSSGGSMGPGFTVGIVELFFRSGLWELIFSPKLSSNLLKWVSNFSPEIIYVQGWDLSLVRLALTLHRKFSIPICLHIPDDWPECLYRERFFNFISRYFVQNAFRKIAANSSVRFSNGKLMSAEYKKRYNLDFQPMMICDEFGRFSAANPERPTGTGVFSIVYSGSLATGRWRSLDDLCEAIENLEINDKEIKIYAYSANIPGEAEEILLKRRSLRLLPALSDNQMPGVFKGADILFLPESFDRRYFFNLHLSISTKAHLYMMSEKPILVYGPAYAGVVDYAKNSGWGHVVEQRDKNLLAKAVVQLLSDEKLCLGMIDCGRKTVIINHDASLIREKFRCALLKALEGKV